MKFRNLFFSISLICSLLFFSCKEKTEAPSIKESDELAEDELLYRPNFHFTPKANWMNDPNGMFYKDGLYHLYFQYYPDDNVWGPMHWGHAESKDMIKWEQKEIAIYPDSLGYIFSGSAVVDIENTSGLGQMDDPAIIAIFTYHPVHRQFEIGVLFIRHKTGVLRSGALSRIEDQNTTLLNLSHQNWV